MIIDSADGDSHMIMENMEVLSAEGSDVVAYDNGKSSGFVIGRYATHEKAQKVAADIENAFLAGEKKFQMPPDEEPKED